MSDEPTNLTADAIADLLQRLQRLEDERDVREAIDRYCLLTDHGSDEEWLDAWTDDGVMDLALSSDFLAGNTALQASLQGEPYEDGIRFVRREGLRGFRAGRHASIALRPNRETKHCHVQVVCNVEGDTATAESYLIAISWEDGDIKTYALGRTRDWLVRSPDRRWRFKKRLAVTAGAKIREKIGRDI